MALKEFTQAFKHSLSPEVLNPTAHARMQAVKAVMTDDNGLNGVQKAKVISKFTDAAVVDMYMGVRVDRSVMIPFLHELLNPPTTGPST